LKTSELVYVFKITTVFYPGCARKMVERHNLVRKISAPKRNTASREQLQAERAGPSGFSLKAGLFKLYPHNFAAHPTSPSTRGEGLFRI
jgi:hypothetical protein